MQIFKKINIIIKNCIVLMILYGTITLYRKGLNTCKLKKPLFFFEKFCQLKVVFNFVFLVDLKWLFWLGT